MYTRAFVVNMSHHKAILIDGKKVGHARVRNDGVILSIWIDTYAQRWLFLPEDREIFEMLGGEEE